MIETSILIATMAGKSLATAAVSRKVDRRGRFLVYCKWHLMGCMARFIVICCEMQASIVIVQVVNSDSMKQLVLCENLSIAGCKGEGNTLKPYLPEK